MAASAIEQVLSFEASEALTAGKFVNFTSGGLVQQVAAATDAPIGVGRDTVAAGGTQAVVIGGRTLVLSGGALAPGDFLTVDSSGRAVKATPGVASTSYVVGRAFETAAGANALVSAIVFPAQAIALTA